MRPSQWLNLSDGSILSRQEQFVLRQVAKGEIADLKEEFGETEEERRLRARFLEELLTGELPGVKVHRRGVLIENAVVEEPLDLENAEVDVDVALDKFIFKASVSFRDGSFKNHLFLSGAHFSKGADFIRIKVAGSIFCRNALFSGPVNFAAATINGQFAAGGAKFLAKDQKAIFNSLKVGQSANFTSAEFHGPLDFGGADIKGQFVAQEGKFLSEKHEATFNGIQVGLSAHFDRAEFHGMVDFLGAKIGRQFVAHGAKFLAQNHKVNFHRMRVGQDAFFRGCDFHGVVSFVLIEIGGDFHLDHLLKSGHDVATTFQSDVNLRGAEIGGEFKADRAQFLGHSWVNFSAVQVGRDFSARGTIFAGPVKFESMQVKKDFLIDPFGKSKSSKTLFKGPANFSRVVVDGVFNADQAIFASENVIFSGLKVGLGAFFNGTIFFEGLELKDGQLTDLEISGLHRLSKGGLPLTEIILNRTKIEHRLTIENIEVKRFHARNLEVKGPAELKRVVIKGEADLRDASLHHLQMVETAWPVPQEEGKEKTLLDGLAYQSLIIKTDQDFPKKPWKKYLHWLSCSRLNLQNYSGLDAYFQRGGLKKSADKVYIAGKSRELGKRKWWHPANWLIWFFWGVLAGYGRKPGRAFYASLIIIILGAIVFDPATFLKPELLSSAQGFWKTTEISQSWLPRFILSVNNFLPAVDLGLAKEISLTTIPWWALLYFQFHKLCGWILIPLGLAALSTRLK